MPVLPPPRDENELVELRVHISPALMLQLETLKLLRGIPRKDVVAAALEDYFSRVDRPAG